MTRIIQPADLDLRDFVRPGDQIVWGEAAGEPQTLTEALVAQRAGLGGVSVFLVAGFSATLQPEHADHIRFVGLGGIGALRRLTRAEVMEIIPCHVGQVVGYLRSGAIPCDVAFVQTGPPGPDGRYSYGVAGDFIPEAVRQARVVIAEVNDQAPFTYGDATLAPDRIDAIVPTSRPVVEVPPGRIGPVEQAIAGFATPYVGDGATVQMGVGAIPDAVLQGLADRRDLGIHTGIVSDVLVDLVEAGAVTNARKPIDPGVSITGLLAGTKRLYDFAHRNRAVGIRDSLYTHGDATLGLLPDLVTVNSAIEVDLTGQVGAEHTATEFIGGIGGQADFVRTGQRAARGHAIVALPATARTASRIVPLLSGSVTTARADADVIVTEFGAAELRARTIRERARRLIAIAHPDHREALERAAHTLFKRGF